MMKKKILFIFLLALFLFCPSGFGFSQETSQLLPLSLLTEQENLLLKAQSLVKKIQKNNSSLLEQLNNSKMKTIGLTNSLQNLTEKFGVQETQLMKSQENLKQAQQLVTTLTQNSQQQQASLNEALSSIDQSKKEYQKLQTENTLIKIVGGGLIVGLGILLLLNQ